MNARSDLQPPRALFACVSRLPSSEGSSDLASIAREFSPRYECHGADLVCIDVSGLQRLLGPPRTIAEELRRESTARGVRVHVAVAATHTAALVAAQGRPGVTMIPRGAEADALAAIPIGILEKIDRDPTRTMLAEAVVAFQRWGIKTLGDLAALPDADLVARLGVPARVWQAIARGEDTRPLIPALDEERFESSLELEWPIDGLEPLSFVLTRLLEPLSTRLERRDRGAAVLHVILRLVTRDSWMRRLELPSPMRDVRTLRTLALLDLEAHPPPAAIDRVAIVIDPTPGRVLQHTLFTRAHPTPEQLSTLIARLGALMGQDRLGAAARVDSYRPGAFAMWPFKTDQEAGGAGRAGRAGGAGKTGEAGKAGEVFAPDVITAGVRRCRHPVPARVALAGGRPVRVTSDRRGFGGGAVTHCAGPWRSTGEWWADRAGKAGGAGQEMPQERSVPPSQPPWNRDEWDVALNDGAVYRIFQDRDTEAWFIDGIVD